MNAQPFEKTFVGSWASTSWTFEFHTDGTYRRISAGHYGNTNVEGRYERKGDSLRLTAFENTYGPVNEYYVLDSRGMLIDLDLRFDYMPLKNGGNFYVSRTRDIKYPQTETGNADTRADLEQALNLALNSKEALSLFHFDRFPERKLRIAKYGALQANLQIGHRQAVFQPKAAIRSPFFIEFEDINQNSDRIDIQFHVHGEDARALFYLEKQNNVWVIKDVDVDRY